MSWTWVKNNQIKGIVSNDSQLSYKSVFKISEKIYIITHRLTDNMIYRVFVHWTAKISTKNRQSILNSKIEKQIYLYLVSYKAL